MSHDSNMPNQFINWETIPSHHSNRACDTTEAGGNRKLILCARQIKGKKAQGKLKSLVLFAGNKRVFNFKGHDKKEGVS